MLDVTNKNFNSIFHFYFDREQNLKCYVFFNLSEFLKYNSNWPEIYDNDSFFQIIKNSIKFKFSLCGEHEESYEIKDITSANIFENNKILSFLLKIDVKNISGKYFIRSNVSYTDKFYDYLSIRQNLKDQETYQEDIYINNLKEIYDKKYINQFKPKVLNQNYEFLSEDIIISEKKCKISNLYDIFSDVINVLNYNAYILDSEFKKGQNYNGQVPVSKFILNGQERNLDYNFSNKTGNISQYLDLSTNLLNYDLNRFDYKQIDFLKNIFIPEKSIDKKNIKIFETISALQADSCDNQILKNFTERELKGSDILYVSSFFENFNIDVDDRWIDDYKILPVYLVEILTKYRIFYLKEINEFSMFETWQELTKEEISNLKSGKYLCMFAADNLYIQNNIIENYFVLEV